MSEELPPCQCGGEAVDRGHGIECRKCGIWLGNGSAAQRLGGYVKVWKSRTTPEYKYDTPENAIPLNGYGCMSLDADFTAGFNAAREVKE